jgi:hypothetical protein
VLPAVAMAVAMRASICDKCKKVAADISTNSSPINASGTLASSFFHNLIII